MTDLVCVEQSCNSSATMTGGNNTSDVVVSSAPSIPLAPSDETSMVSPSVSPPSSASGSNSSCVINIPSTIAVSAAAAAAAILTNPSLSSFRQLAELWHPHVYNSAEKMPTPFSIEDILKERKRDEANNSKPIPQYDNGIRNVFSHLNLPNLSYRIDEPSTSVGLLPELTNALAQHMVASSVQMQQSSRRGTPAETKDKCNTSPR